VTRRVLALAAAVLVLSPAAALAGTSTSNANANASTQCTALLARLGDRPFARAFTSFRGCVSDFAPLALRTATLAAATCRAMQADTGFAAAHGGQSFDAYFGIGSTQANAFANCIAATINARIAAQVAVAAGCLPERASSSFAASHRGKTFAQFYGTGPTLANAFKRCVVLKVMPLTVQPAQTSTPTQSATQTQTQALTPTKPTGGLEPSDTLPSVIGRECGGSSGAAPLHPQPMETNSCAVASPN
jgi:hypothetical protein